MIDVNTTSIYPTHFLRGVELVKQASIKYDIPTETWPTPTQYRYGMPMDHYYSEVWANGMDWQMSYWMIEELDLKNPQIQPFIIFENNEESEKFNHHDFSMLVHASFYYRRDCTFIGHNQLGFYSDIVWSHLTLFKNEIKYEKMKMFAFEHASQEPVIFWMNTIFVPGMVVDKGNDENKQKTTNSDNVIKLMSNDK